MHSRQRVWLRHPRWRGFSLIEILIALAVLAILASVAMPYFYDSIRKGRRSEAVAALTALQQAQERRRANEPAYTTTLSALGIGSSTTGNGHYTIAIDSADAVGYVATATAVGAQAGDKACQRMRVRVHRGNISYGSVCTTCELTEPLTDPNRCWSRQ